jgi:hypothetical protein
MARMKKAVEDVRDGQPKTTSPIRAIRLKCLDCTCGSQKEIEACPIVKCALHPFRFGKNPFRKPVSEERRAAASERMRKLQAKKRGEESDV